MEPETRFLSESSAWKEVWAQSRAPELEIGARLLAELSWSPEHASRTAQRVAAFVEEGKRLFRAPWVDEWLAFFSLDKKEGVLLAQLAEILSRVTDPELAARAIRDKISQGQWLACGFQNASLPVALLGLLIASGAWISRLGEGPWTNRVLVWGSEQLLALFIRRFVFAEDVTEALQKATNSFSARYSLDMLGEGARNWDQAKRHWERYRRALEALPEGGPEGQWEISVKLSALYPRFSYRYAAGVFRELLPALRELCILAQRKGCGLVIDAEETDRLGLALELAASLWFDARLQGWTGPGFVVQAYQKRARSLIDLLEWVAVRSGKTLPVRLVKGAYWDWEIRRAQSLALEDYPVFSRKELTELSFLACAKALFQKRPSFRVQIASHNPWTMAAVFEFVAPEDVAWEAQRLYGMGEPLEGVLRHRGIPCRIYAPVGARKDLLGYLVRRLLENGASQVASLPLWKKAERSFTTDPIIRFQEEARLQEKLLPRPVEIYLPKRKAASEPDLSDPLVRRELWEATSRFRNRTWEARPVVGGKPKEGVARWVFSPRDLSRVIGRVEEASPSLGKDALCLADQAFASWEGRPVEERASVLRAWAERMEKERPALVSLLVEEAGKTVPNALSEVREAVDLCRYYAAEAERLVRFPQRLPGPSGERNELFLRGRGVFLCLSPWNFPLSIFVGQVAAALVCGNTVVAKPAPQTPLVAALAVKLGQEAGVPPEALQFLPGGSELGKSLLEDPRVSGVAFTGSTRTAQKIFQVLAGRGAFWIPLLAETGGINAMIVDGTALPEQAVDDIITSAFDSGGQRCSSLRVLFVSEEIAEVLLPLLEGAIREISVGDPWELDSDVGPMIGQDACRRLESYTENLAKKGRLLARAARSPSALPQGAYFLPEAWEVSWEDLPTEEVFGPILHVVRYQKSEWEKIFEWLASTGTGLTLGLETRLDGIIAEVTRRAQVGNLYVNRPMIGALVEAQPFGGEKLSGTGPKAGGPYYLLRFLTERVRTHCTAAWGGDPELLVQAQSFFRSDRST
ncbi:bifunctional proline dehydrogenase/L-glutamate gamma-semialdehyde dehydrogenase PutA [Candidatus Methylacidithermus pantelleriae]|uniref:Proline dehydrogenase / Delta-1-pyrroline-5-carboxylate dehydrogenase n=1 Tax=Candidatus Methylacidithermus pantelleriae TaxID=2744239 RepID=A0A8J2BJ70_9BACT|nr:bifunctional proline dehydrogenase/L-glutamate gamma-semialdehyde dehydrogenase PutA [Candidatus Methylacidithermus pantelleriae]CAF0691474.1 Proline dehydrogenase / Delta-1-pyrroline-5-carboxylate dehydrogenase [Candidatus Methylacidithermus pantelleriae]